MKEKGITYQRGKFGIEILKGDKWVKLLDIDTVEHHLRWYPKDYKPLPAEYINRVYVERLGEQITRRGLSLIETGAEGRVKDLPKFVQDVEALAKEKPQYKELLDRFVEDVEMFIKAKESGEPGIYLGPYAAEFFAAGDNPGLVLLLTDTSKIKGVASEVLAKAGQSDWFIRQAEKGLYEPSKTWWGAFETEVVASPGTEFKVPPPTADFVTRMLAGKASDLFTYSTRQERFLPIRVLADKGVLPELPTPAKLYGVKLHAFAVSLQNFIEAVKHPGRTLGDIVHGRPGPKGVREMEVVGVDIRRANGIDAIAARLEAEARTRAARLAKTKEDFERIFERELEEAYQRENKRLLDRYRSQVEKEYRTELGRERFEDLYRYQVGRDFRTLARMQQFARNLAPALSRAREEMRREGVRPERVSGKGKSCARRKSAPHHYRPT